MGPGSGLAFAAICASLAALLIILLKPLLSRHLLAMPNARSSHLVPTPQGAGIAVVGAVLLGYAGLWLVGLVPEEAAGAAPVLAATAALALLGLLDDALCLPISWRLAGQALAALALLFSLPESLRVLPEAVPFWLERSLLLLAVLAIVNAINFLDGIDLMTVAQTVPIAGAVAILYAAGAIPAPAGFVSLALLGGMLGFALFNRHPAQVFLGDAGSLPVGLLVAWLLIEVAGVNLFAALLLPLYAIADASLTLWRRFAAGEPLFQAHREHFYQRALDAGYSVPEVTLRVFVLGLLLASLAIGAVMLQSPLANWVLLALGLGATAYLLGALVKAWT